MTFYRGSMICLENSRSLMLSLKNSVLPPYIAAVITASTHLTPLISGDPFYRFSRQSRGGRFQNGKVGGQALFSWQKTYAKHRVCDFLRSPAPKSPSNRHGLMQDLKGSCPVECHPC